MVLCSINKVVNTSQQGRLALALWLITGDKILRVRANKYESEENKIKWTRESSLKVGN